MPIPHSLKRPLPLAIAFFLAVTCGHFIALPLLITWDGHDYVDLADVLGSPRFPGDWRLLRAPLFPLGLKISFLIFGRGPLAAELVPLVMAVLGCLLLASSVRRVAGERAAAATLALLALYPALIAFEHAILTETGTFFFLALSLRLSLWNPRTPADAWKKALGLGLALGAGYYWRQALFLLAPWFALLHVLSIPGPIHGNRRGLALAGLQAILVMLLPWSFGAPWRMELGAERLSSLNATVMNSFVIRQAVIPPEDGRVASVRETYRAAIGHADPLAGIPWREIPGITSGMAPVWKQEGTLRWFASIAGEYPGRYARAVGRTLLLFAGLDSAENEIHDNSNLVLSPDVQGSLIGAGRPPLMEKDRRELAMSTGDGLLRAGLRGLVRPYAWLVIAGNLATLGLLAFSLWRRDLGRLAFSGTAAVFALSHALPLFSIPRFMLPVYPITLACGLVAAFREGYTPQVEDSDA
jgi:4-amino-4-deoxy-L-arabinose transferase-like glycosyltransferase